MLSWLFAITMLGLSVERPVDSKEVLRNILTTDAIVKLFSIDMLNIAPPTAEFEFNANVHLGILHGDKVIASSDVVKGLAGNKGELVVSIGNKHYTAKVLSHQPMLGFSVLGIEAFNDHMSQEMEYSAKVSDSLDIIYCNSTGNRVIAKGTTSSKPVVRELGNGIYGKCVFLEASNVVPVGALVFNRKHKCIGIVIELKNRIHAGRVFYADSYGENVKVVRLFDEEQIYKLQGLVNKPLDEYIGKFVDLRVDVADLTRTDQNDSRIGVTEGVKVRCSSNQEILPDDVIIELCGNPVKSRNSFYYMLQLMDQKEWTDRGVLPIKLIRAGVVMAIEVPIVLSDSISRIHVEHGVFKLVDLNGISSKYKCGLVPKHIAPHSAFYRHISSDKVIVAVDGMVIYGGQSGSNLLRVLSAALSSGTECSITTIPAGARKCQYSETEETTYIPGKPKSKL